jgi:hypothetical protein
MKAKIRLFARRISTWPVVGRFIRIIIAVIRLPEERIQLRQFIEENNTRLRNEENAILSIKERLNRQEVFISSQIPRLAEKVAELHHSRLQNH